MTGGIRGQPPIDEDAEHTLSVIRDEFAEGRCDLHGGGVPTSVIAARIGYEQGSVPNHVRPLILSGDIEQVWGIAFDSGIPRRSYVPLEDEDGDGE